MVGPRFPDSFKEELKNRIRISDVVGRKVKLTRKGKEWGGLSPFTNEKTPSFFVNDQKQFFKCFSSGKFGDVITFVMETERLGFNEAIEKLALEAGMALPTDTPEARAERSRRSRLIDAMELATQFFEDQLRGPDGLIAREYLARRGLPKESWSKYRLGYAPKGWQGLRSYLAGKGVTDADMLACNLISESKKAREPFDRFKNRLMFTIEDTSGKPIAFGARALDPDDNPKYVNTSETELFHKGQQLYRYRAAREAAAMANANGLIVCEGYMDVIALSEAGWGNAVAPLGTALTNEQLALLWKVGDEPIICFDGDGAGIRASNTAIDRALPLLEPGRSLFFAQLPDKKDPDDILKAEGGKAVLTKVFETARPLVDMLWSRETDGLPLDTPERRLGFEQRIGALVGAIANEGIRKAYSRELNKRLRDLIYGQNRNDRDHPNRQIAPQKNVAFNPRGLRLLTRFIDSPQLLEAGLERLAVASFPDPNIQGLKDALFDLVDSVEKVDRTDLTSHLRQLGKEEALHLLRTQPKTPPLDPASDAGREWLDALERFCAVDELSQDHRRLLAGDRQKVMDDGRAAKRLRLETEIRDLTRGADEDAVEGAKQANLKAALSAFDEIVERKQGGRTSKG